MTITIAQRVETVYPEEYAKLKDAIDLALSTIPMDSRLEIKFSIQMPVPEELWYVFTQYYDKYDWELYKDTKSHNIHHVTIKHSYLQED